MMDDVISRKAAIDAVEWGITLAIAVNTITGEKRQLFREGNNALRKAAERIKELPPVQSEIIRCKECVHADIFYHCDYMTTWHDGECFCSHGKRRTDGRSNQKTGCD